MSSKPASGSSLAFVVKNGKDIREIVRLIRTEAQKGRCSESEITLISTAISEVCRILIRYSGLLEFTFTVLSKTGGIELQCKAHIPVAPRDTDWNIILRSLNTYFSEVAIAEHNKPPSLSYSFRKYIPRAART